MELENIALYSSALCPLTLWHAKRHTTVWPNGNRQKTFEGAAFLLQGQNFRTLGHADLRAEVVLPQRSTMDSDWRSGWGSRFFANKTCLRLEDFTHPSNEGQIVEEAVHQGHVNTNDVIAKRTTVPYLISYLTWPRDNLISTGSKERRRRRRRRRLHELRNWVTHANSDFYLEASSILWIGNCCSGKKFSSSSPMPFKQLALSRDPSPRLKLAKWQ